MIIYTCPVCGQDLQTFILCSNPPQTQYSCPSCGWNEIERSSEEIIRVPYGGNTYTPIINHLPLYDYETSDKTSTRGICEFCPTNPRNGGDGICHCILGSMDIKC